MSAKPDQPAHGDLHLHDGGLLVDLPQLLSRRRLIGLIGGAGGALLLGACSGSDSSSDASVAAGDTSSSPSSAPATDGSPVTTTNGVTPAPAEPPATSVATDGSASTVCEVIPAETAGPFPANGSNGPNVLSESGVVRSDISTSFGSMSGTAEGAYLTLTLAINDSATCGPLVGAAVYLWHCDAEGRYSLYSDGVTDQNYLRGVQETDATGSVTFTTIFPGCYEGRWPHMHFEVYSSLAEATSSAGLIATSQVAFDTQVSEFAYASDGYEASAANFSRLSLDRDGVFGDDGAVAQMAAVNGSLEEGLFGVLELAV